MNQPQADSETQKALAEFGIHLQYLTESNRKLVAAIDKLATIEAQNQARDEKTTSHEVRITKLEVNFWRATGAISTLAFFGPMVARAMGLHI